MKGKKTREARRIKIIQGWIRAVNPADVKSKQIAAYVRERERDNSYMPHGEH